MYYNGCFIGRTRRNILEQEDENGKKHPIGYTSRKLKGREKNYTTTELELAAVVFIINYFREYLLGRELIVYSDHSHLQYFITMKNPSSITGVANLFVQSVK